jgi:hypothetical protein
MLQFLMFPYSMLPSSIKILDMRAKLKASTDRILPAGRMLCMPALELLFILFKWPFNGW